MWPEAKGIDNYIVLGRWMDEQMIRQMPVRKVKEIDFTLAEGKLSEELKGQRGRWKDLHCVAAA